MSNFKDKYIEQLFADQRFSPVRQKVKMLDTAEQLSRIVRAGQDYPFEFVCFKITGYRPDSEVDPHLISGEVLLDDLLEFVLAMSRSLSQPVQMIKEPVWTIPSAAAKLGVSTKTIHRWRSRGLLCRSFIFEDGKRRLGILDSSLKYFTKAHKDIAEKGISFSRLDARGREQISKLALELAQGNRSWSRQRLLREVAAKTNRSIETVRNTLINEYSNGSKTDRSPAAISPEQAAAIYAAYEKGTAVRQLMKRYNRSKSSIYRIINSQKMRKLRGQKIEYIDNELFHSKGEVQRIISLEGVANVAVPPEYLEKLPGNIEKLKNAPILTRDQEQSLFKLYNCLKYEAKRLLEESKNCERYDKNTRKIEKLIERAEKIKNILVCCNLRLVVATAAKHQGKGASHSELVSEGCMALIRAVEGYDFDNKSGSRFATYAVWGIRRSFAKKMPTSAVSLIDDISEIDLMQTAGGGVADIEQANQDLKQVISQNLNEREQYIIINHYGLEGSLIRRNYKTMKQIGDELGISGERVRQIELQAIQKLRKCLSTEMFEALLK